MTFNLKKGWKFGLLIIILLALVFLITKSLGSFLVSRVFSSIKKDFHQSASIYPIVVNNDLVSWQELDQVLEFEEMLWQNDPLGWQLKGLVFQRDYEKKIIIDLLIERKIIGQIATDYQLSDLSKDEIEAAKIVSFGHHYRELSFNSHPEMEKRAITRALKEKLSQSSTKRYSGALIHIKFRGWGAADFDDPQALAQNKINQLYQKAKDDLSVDSLVELANNDSEITLLNDHNSQKAFQGFSQEDFSISSPDIQKNLKDLRSGQLSQIFELTTLMDPSKDQYEVFAYGFFKITEVSGFIQSTQEVIQQIKDKAVIEINIR